MVDVGRAATGASQLRTSMSQLSSAKNMLIRYKAMFGTSWQGTEICYYIAAIDEAIRQIDSLGIMISQLANDYINTANTIRHEEEEAERLAREAAERAAREAAEAARAALAALNGRLTI